ncbi:MAG: hypothetical protein HOP29_11045 [Phycisphaerales bacterium]|nr:hypothetical protein [Phycisphaerales bacterium]
MTGKLTKQATAKRKTAKKSAKVGRAATAGRRGDKAPAKQVAAKAAKPRKAVAESAVRKPTEETTRAARR